jgi:hypothetical protein
MKYFMADNAREFFPSPLLRQGATQTSAMVVLALVMRRLDRAWLGNFSR